MSYKKVYLKAGKEESLKRFHPWIFSGAISHIDGEPDEGEVVEVYTSKKDFIAEGHFQIGSIAVRVLSFKQEEVNLDFWKQKLQIAYDMRKSIGVAAHPTTPTDWCTARATTCPDLSLMSMQPPLLCRHIRPVCTWTAWR